MTRQAGATASYRIAKRTIDLGASLVGLLLTSPLFLLLAIWIKLDSKGPVFYRGQRSGKDGATFGMYKFRSMVTNADRIGGPTTAENDPRVTRAGRFIRRFKLDEIPQLINVFVGDMSLVGPRPDVPSEIAKLTREERETIFAVRPGMTDWASIRFHNEGEIVSGNADPHEAYERLIRPHKIELQKEYATSISFSTDVRILWATFRMLAKKANHDGAPVATSQPPSAR